MFSLHTYYIFAYMHWYIYLCMTIFLKSLYFLLCFLFFSFKHCKNEFKIIVIHDNCMTESNFSLQSRLIFPRLIYIVNNSWNHWWSTARLLSFWFDDCSILDRLNWLTLVMCYTGCSLVAVCTHNICGLAVKASKVHIRALVILSLIT